MANFLDTLHNPGTCLYGTWAKINSIETLEILAYSGFDFVVIDTEHAPHTYESTYRSIVLAQALGMKALVRLPGQGSHDVQRVLDSGADGFLMPRVRHAGEARRVVEETTFSPLGCRGMGITSRAGDWGLMPVGDYLARGNTAVARVLQLEDAEALEQCEEILDVAGVNAIFVGLGDLALSTGKPGHHPDNEALVRKLLAAARARGIPCGTAVGDAAAASHAREQGFGFVMVSNDLTLFARATRDVMRQIVTLNNTTVPISITSV